MKIVAIVAAALAALLSAYTAAAHFSIRGVNAYLFDTTWGGIFAASQGFTLLAAILCWLLALLFLALLLRKRRRQKKEEKLPVQKEMGQAEAPAGRKAGKERKKRGKKGEEEPRIQKRREELLEEIRFLEQSLPEYEIEYRAGNGTV